jgi:hypothetical protein
MGKFGKELIKSLHQAAKHGSGKRSVAVRTSRVRVPKQKSKTSRSPNR